MFSSVEEATQKLSNSVIVYKDEPVYVQRGWQMGRKVGVQVVEYWNGGELRTYSLDDPDLNYKDLGDRIGYVNYIAPGYREAVYCSRSPIRRAHSTQGISRDNLIIDNLVGNAELGSDRMGLSWESLYPTTSFAAMLRKSYPSYFDCLNTLSTDKTFTSKAFERQWALNRDPLGVLYLEYRGHRVGYADHRQAFKFSDEYEYLKKNFLKKFPYIQVL